MKFNKLILCAGLFLVVSNVQARVFNELTNEYTYTDEIQALLSSKNPANVEKAINMIETQANKGSSDGLALKFDILHNYGVDLKGNQVSHSDAVNFLKEWADKGNTGAQFLLANEYAHCQQENNYKEAVRYFEKAYNAGYIQAAWALARMYRFGRGVDFDYNKAVALNQEVLDYFYDHPKLSETGKLLLASTLNELGNMAERGQGMTPDKNKAKEYYYRACKLDVMKLACDNYQLMVSQGY